MARKRKRPADQGGITTLCIVAGACYLVSRFSHAIPASQTRNAKQFALWLASIVLVLCLLPVLKRFFAHRGVAGKAKLAVKKHLPSLIRRKAQLAQKDAYGRLKTESWDKELIYFMEHQVEPALSSSEQLSLQRNRAATVRMIDRLVDDATARQPVTTAFSDGMTPSEFEMFCATALREAGWDARVTLQSRDQGVDVIAEKRRVRIVLQCKLYARPVGNKSVQEAAAAKMHERAHYAAVVSNNRYTAAAEQLAATNGVLLLHYRDLPGLENMLGGAFAARR